MRFLAAACLLVASAHARCAEIVLERSGVEKLVVQALFKDRGRLTLARGPCASYLEQPTVSLENRRIQIRAHLSARLGFVVNGDCAGVELSSWAKVSGRPVPAGGSVRMEDIRIDEVDDANTRALLANSGLAAALPNAVELDVRSALQTMLQQSVEKMQATVESFAFQDVAVANDRLTLRFDFRLLGK
jgi:hypothetical protein